MTVFLYVTMTAFILICVILVSLILIQKGRGGGLASAFGGAGGQTAFGSKTGDVLTWATSIVFAIFVALAVVLNLIANHIDAHPASAAVVPISANLPAAPGSPNSSLPQAPQGDPGIAHPPALPSPTPTTLPAVQSMSAPASPSVPTFPTTMPTLAAPVLHNTTMPTTLP